MEEEEKETGVVKLAVYKEYWRAVGMCLSPLVLVSLFLMQGTLINHLIAAVIFVSPAKLSGT